MLFIIELGARYRYNVWTVAKLEGDIPSYERDARVFCSDYEKEFIEFIRELESQEGIDDELPF